MYAMAQLQQESISACFLATVVALILIASTVAPSHLRLGKMWPATKQAQYIQTVLVIMFILLYSKEKNFIGHQQCIFVGWHIKAVICSAF
jgi:hypothetical protein